MNSINRYIFFAVIIAFTGGIATQVIQSKQKEIKRLKDAQNSLKTQVRQINLTINQLQRINAGQKYAMCLILTKQIQYAPAIKGTIMQFDGITNYASKHLPDSLLFCKCNQ